MNKMKDKMNLSRALKILGWQSIQNRSAKNGEILSGINSGNQLIYQPNHSENHTIGSQIL